MGDHRAARGAVAIRVAWFLTDHGWGHLTRSSTVISRLLGEHHDVLVVVGPQMVAAATEIDPRVEVISGRLDLGYARLSTRGSVDGAPGVDIERTRSMLVAAGQPDPAITRRVSAWHPDVVVADATPWASLVGAACGVPSVLCSSFSWDDQYEAIFAQQPALSTEVQAIRAAVQRFTLGLEIPLGSGLPSVPERRQIPLVARSPEGKPHPWLAAQAGRDLAAWTFGQTSLAAQPWSLFEVFTEICQTAGAVPLLDTTSAEGVGDGPWGVAPPDVPWPDVLSAARLVVTKAGYSTVAEALRGHAYVLPVGVTGLPEEQGLIAEVERDGYGLGIRHGDPDPAGTLRDHAALLWARPPRAPLAADGAGAVVAALQTLAEGG